MQFLPAIHMAYNSRVSICEYELIFQNKKSEEQAPHLYSLGFLHCQEMGD